MKDIHAFPDGEEFTWVDVSVIATFLNGIPDTLQYKYNDNGGFEGGAFYLHTSYSFLQKINGCATVISMGAALQDEDDALFSCFVLKANHAFVVCEHLTAIPDEPPISKVGFRSTLGQYCLLFFQEKKDFKFLYGIISTPEITHFNFQWVDQRSVFTIQRPHCEKYIFQN